MRPTFAELEAYAKEQGDSVKIKDDVIEVIFKEGSYHFTKKDMKSFNSAENAYNTAKKECDRKLHALKSNRFIGRVDEKVITWEAMRDRGFCEHGLNKFCDAMKLNKNKALTPREFITMLNRTTDEQWDVVTEYIDEVFSILGQAVQALKIEEKRENGSNDT